MLLLRYPQIAVNTWTIINETEGNNEAVAEVTRLDSGAVALKSHRPLTTAEVNTIGIFMHGLDEVRAQQKRPVVSVKAVAKLRAA